MASPAARIKYQQKDSAMLKSKTGHAAATVGGILTSDGLSRHYIEWFGAKHSCALLVAGSVRASPQHQRYLAVLQ